MASGLCVAVHGSWIGPRFVNPWVRLSPPTAVTEGATRHGRGSGRSHPKTKNTGNRVASEGTLCMGMRTPPSFEWRYRKAKIRDWSIARSRQVRRINSCMESECTNSKP